VRSRPDIRFIPFAVTEFGALGGHATAFSNELAKHATASKGMHVGKLLAPLRRKGFSRRRCHSRGQRLARVVRRSGLWGGRFFLCWCAFSCHGILHLCHDPQAFPCFLARRVRRCLSPPSVTFLALRGNFSCSLVFYLLGLRTL
jgi:hypothetical protein